MTEYSFAAEATSSATPDDVFSLLADATRWKEWAGPFIRESFWEREGSPPPGGIGAIKRLGARPIFSREETVEYDPPRRYAYVILSGQPVTRYKAGVELTPVEGGAGTHIRWAATFEPKVAATGPFMRWYLSKLVAGFTRRLASYAGRAT
ncbi:MAG: Polyketide cyclase/dehydrase [Acidimicrobiales bacterium]|nr:Polyketide cyclase/dehydrase [Acidimicrobiales bacterium]